MRVLILKKHGLAHAKGKPASPKGAEGRTFLTHTSTKLANLRSRSDYSPAEIGHLL